MLKRLLLGLFKGLVVGGIVAAVLVKGLGVVTFGVVLAYLAAVVTGVLVGLVAGKPVWRRGAGVEGGLKAAAGALLGAGALFAVRRWLAVDVDLSAFQAGSGVLGSLPAASLPLVGAVLAMLFDLDNTPSSEEDAPAKKTKTRVAADAERRFDADALLAEEDLLAEDEKRGSGARERRG